MGKRSRRRGEQTEPQDDAEAGGEPAVDGPPAPLRPDGRLREVALLVEEADYTLALYRWIVLTGEVPRAQDWLRREEWPHPDYVIDVFGSWEKFLQHAEVPSSPLLARVREADDERRSVAARQQQAERDLARVDDLRRQVETAKRRREAADTERGELNARAERLAGQLERAEARAAAAEAHLAERRQQAEELAAGPKGEASDEWLAAHEALLDELDAVRAHREELLRQVEELREAAAQDAKAIAQPERDAGGDGRRAGGRPLGRRAAGAAGHRGRGGRARGGSRPSTSSSRAPPTRRRPTAPTGARRTCSTRSCASTRSPPLYADPDGFGRSLSQAADELGLTWRQNVSGLARSRKPHAYSVMHDGERLELGPHVAIGSGSGAGFIARIYLHVADGSGEVPRGLYVGHVGRHLPDTTTA